MRTRLRVQSARPATIVAILWVVFVAGRLWAYNPPSGGEEWYDIVSPTFLGGRADVTDTTAIMGDSVNPAVSGLKERATAAGYYGFVVGPRGEDHPPTGHIVGLDGNLPTQIGVLGANIMYVDSRLAEVDFGRLVRVRATYSRDLFPRLLIGAGANLTTGTADRFFLGLAADLGFVHLLNGFRWGFTMHGLGIGYNPHTVDDSDESVTAFPSVFAPHLGFSVDAYESENLSVRVAGDVSTPRFQNVRAGGSVAVAYRDTFGASIGTRFDLAQQSAPATEQRGWIPSFGVSVNITRLLEDLRGTPRQTYAEEARSIVSVTPLTGSAVAVGFGGSVPIGTVDRSPPEIVLEYDNQSVISPNNDGRFDDLILPIRIEDESLVSGYVLTVEDSDGRIVRRIENKDDRPDLRFDALLSEIREGETGILIPRQLRWNGADDTGRRVPDGEYAFFIESWDNNGNRGASPTYTVTVDTVAPELTVEAPQDRVFSPNGDGNKDSIQIEQTGTIEESITAVIRDSADVPIRRYDYSGSELGPLVWDGSNDIGETAPDGVYSYELSSIDAAGNRTTAGVSNIILNTETQSVFVTTNREGFSPNDDGIQDTVSFELVLAETDGLDGWTFEIVDDGGSVVRSYTGTTPREDPIVWNGTDEDGNRTTGQYRGRLSARYRNGGEPSSESSVVLLDNAAPEVAIDPNPLPFSPDNDGVADDLFIGIDIADESAIARWRLSIIDPRGELFKEFTGQGMPRSELIWDGKSKSGNLVEAAEDYEYQFSIEDVRGNATAESGTIPVDVLVIREDGRLKIRISNITFAPNSPEYVSDDVEQFEKNIDIVNRIAEILSKYDSYQVRIEGHAVNISGTEREQEEELVPLSRARAETVRQSLVERGLDPDRFSVVGVGGTDPIVPHTDEENRWRNRRVEFILIR